MVESDASVATQLLQTVAGYLTTLSTRINAAQNPEELLPAIADQVTPESTDKNA